METYKKKMMARKLKEAFEIKFLRQIKLKVYDEIVGRLQGKEQFTDPDFKPDMSCYASSAQQDSDEFEFIRSKRIAYFTDDDGRLKINPHEATPLDVDINP